jgi:stage IV sporulation protein FB
MPTIKTYRIGNLFGVPMYVDLSFLFIALLVLVNTGNPLLGLLIAAGLGASILAHEFGHSLMAGKYGFRTRQITLTLLGGCAAMEGIPRAPKQEMAVALAGPGVSMVLAAGFLCLSVLTAWFQPLMSAFFILFAINAMLCVFNLIPGFPMDGGRVLRAWLCRKKSRPDATYTAMIVGRVFACLIAVWGVINILSGNFGGITQLLIAWFIWKAGWQEYVMSVYGG